MAAIKLSYNQIEDIASQLSSSASSMEEILNGLKTLFDKVGTEEVWSGTAANATKEKFDTLSAKFPEFVQAIESCNTYLRQIAANYREMDAKIQGMQ